MERSDANRILRRWADGGPTFDHAPTLLAATDGLGIDRALVRHSLGARYDPAWAHALLAEQIARRERLTPCWAAILPGTAEREAVAQAHPNVYRVTRITSHTAAHESGGRRRPRSGAKSAFADSCQPTEVGFAELGANPEPVAPRFSSRRAFTADIWGSTLTRAELESIVAGLGAERALLGTDMPWLGRRFLIGKGACARLSAEEQRLILGENIARPMGWD